MAAAMVLTEEWFAPRLWSHLEAPSDLCCRAACHAWTCSRLPSEAANRGSGVPHALMSLPHLALPHGVDVASAALRWAHRRLNAASLESLRIPVGQQLSPASRALSGGGAGGGSSSSSSHSPSPRFRPGCASGADGQAVEDVLCRLATEGAVEWVAWLLSAQCTPLPGETCRGLGEVCLRRPLHTTSLPQELAPLLALRGGGLDASPPAAVPPFVALRAAASGGHAGVLRVLLAARADVAEADENGCTLLHWAADKGQAAACRELLAARADVDARDDDDWTPLCLAAEEGHLDTCQALLEARAVVNLPDEDLRSPLWWATWKRHQRLVDVLLEFGANPAQGDRNGVTPQGLLSARGGTAAPPAGVVAGVSSG
eukprot:CAMPEP_0203888080 /NCGR_PEP_ID=MMETSP0359-20131031/31726_1 /ASSEMBLY_ACC=CAM_ASM_000338 /TAXON_ID=268821 /ORGANISM="Scrippsiella Hangoei, Strain SHTV-5" /LENGTH=371 /DNA_ID=CAMNT_0050809211 /DNA_START=41 /DNA_END=1152 /DNA_ORIENTATION=-